MKAEIKIYPLFRVIERTKDGNELEHFSSYNWTPAEYELELLKEKFPDKKFYIISTK